MYEHLAKTYFTPQKKQRPVRKKGKFLLILLICTGIAFIFSLAAIKNYYQQNTPQLNLRRSFNLVLIPGSIKLNYNFNAAGKIEVFDFGLNSLDAQNFNLLEFNIRKGSHNNRVSVKIEIVNKLKEKSELYISDIYSRWKKISLPLNHFARITDWSELENLTFAIEEWNTSKNTGIVYIDNVRLVKSEGRAR